DARRVLGGVEAERGLPLRELGLDLQVDLPAIAPRDREGEGPRCADRDLLDGGRVRGAEVDGTLRSVERGDGRRRGALLRLLHLRVELGAGGHAELDLEVLAGGRLDPLAAVLPGIGGRRLQRVAAAPRRRLDLDRVAPPRRQRELLYLV